MTKLKRTDPLFNGRQEAWLPSAPFRRRMEANVQPDKFSAPELEFGEGAFHAPAGRLLCPGESLEQNSMLDFAL